MPAAQLHADDTTVPEFDVGRMRTGRRWTYMRDDRPFGGGDLAGGRRARRIAELLPRNWKLLQQ